MSAVHSLWSARQEAVRRAAAASAATPAAADRGASGVPAAWPDGTFHTPDDVYVDGASLAEAAASVTPSIRVGSVARPGGRSRWVAVIATRVVHVDRAAGALRLDAELGAVSPHLEAARLLGRISIARRSTFVVTGPSGRRVAAARLPRDLVAGDVLAVPCDGPVDPRAVADARRG